MKNYLQNKTQYYKSFADAMQKKFMQVRFGVKSCSIEQDLQNALLRKEIADWQQNNDGGALTEVSINYMTNFEVTYDQDASTPELDIDSHYGGTGGVVSNCHSPLRIFKVNQVYGDNSANLVEVNTEGCVTRINLNSNVNIAGGNFIFNQTTPVATWHINHGLHFIPNIYTRNEAGIPIEGVIVPIDQDNIDIQFSSPVAGTAYLS